MKKQVLLINISIICLFLIPGCVTDNASFKNKFTLVASEDDTISIRLEENSGNFSYYIQYFRSNDTDFLATLNYLNNSIELYDINSNKLYKTLVIPQEGNNSFPDLRSFICEKFDSILLFSMMPPRIGIIDTGGHMLKTIPHDKKIGSLQGGERPFRLGDNIYLSQLHPARESNGKLTPTGQKSSFINLTVDLITGTCEPSPLTYPEELTGQNVFIMRVERVLGYKNCFVYHFGLINSLFLTYDHLTFERVPLETNYKLKILDDFNPTSSINSYLNDKLLHDEVECLYYDEFRECYYITIKKREEDRINNSSITAKSQYPECYILILDKNLKHIGEVHFPKDMYSFRMCFVTGKGLYISEDHVNNPGFNDDYMRFRLFTLEKTKNHVE
jgi:hypothetical protein